MIGGWGVENEVWSVSTKFSTISKTDFYNEKIFSNCVEKYTNVATRYV